MNFYMTFRYATGSDNAAVSRGVRLRDISKQQSATPLRVQASLTKAMCTDNNGKHE